MKPKTCECCGQTIRVKALKTVAIQDTSTMNTAQVYAYYKKTSHIEDVRFFLGCSTFTDESNIFAVNDLLCAAIAGLPKAETLRRLCNIQDEWRRERNAAERLEWIERDRLAAIEQSDAA